MSLHTFKDLIIEVKRYTDVTGLLIGKMALPNSEEFTTVFELQFHTKLFPVNSGDHVQLVIGVNAEDVALEDVAEYVTIAKVVQVNWRENPPHFITSSGGMIGRFYISRENIQSIIDVGNDCRLYLNKINN